MPTEAGIGSFRMRLTMGEPLLAITRSPHPPALRAPSPTGRRENFYFNKSGSSSGAKIGVRMALSPMPMPENVPAKALT